MAVMVIGPWAMDDGRRDHSRLDRDPTARTVIRTIIARPQRILGLTPRHKLERSELGMSEYCVEVCGEVS